MRDIRLSLPLGAALLLAGCHTINSIRPLVTRDAAVTEPDLEGIWKSTDASGRGGIARIEFRKDSYPVQCEDDKYFVRLTRIGDSLFADAWTDAPGTSIEGHVFARLRLNGDVLAVLVLNSGWLREQIVKRKFPAAVHREKSLILTASTAGLRKYVEIYANEARAYEDAVELRRVR